MTGGYGMLATTPAIYGDVVVEVTAHFSGDIQAHPYDSLGLALHTSDRENAEVLFIVDSLGQWSIGPYPDAPIRNTGEIKGGLGTPNRLSVLMQGQEYICFINGTFVGLYQTNHTSTGHLGIFYGGQALVASFNDFTVYPL